MARFVRTSPPPPVRGGYEAFRPYVRGDFEECCAYCLLSELFAGGEDNFEIDHFRPRKLFPDALHDFYNLYYSCHPCNHIKHDKWPSKALHELGIGFVDLCQDDFSDQFEICSDGTWKPLTQSAAYTIDSLRLNRRHLVRLRLLLAELHSREDEG
jgi:uncharacterized protein (TIGR02646 family)